MKLTRRTVLAAASCLAMLAQPLYAQDLPRNIRMVIGSTSTGGDTYQASSIVAEALSAKLGVNIKVDAVGPSEGFKALARDKRGATIMVFHDQAFLANIYGVPGNPDPFADYAIGPTLMINPGNAYLVAKNSPYQTMEDILTAAANGERIRVAIQPGGVSEIGFTAMRNAARVRAPGSQDNIVPMNTGSQGDKNQAMFDGLAEVINGSIQANEQFTALPAEDQKAMRFVWLTATPETLQQAPEAGMGELTREKMLEYASPKASVTLDGSQDFTFDKEFFLLFNKDMDPAQMQAIDAALAEIFQQDDVRKRMQDAFFMPDFRPMAEAAAHLKAKRDTYAGVIEALKTPAQ